MKKDLIMTTAVSLVLNGMYTLSPEVACTHLTTVGGSHVISSPEPDE